MRDIISQSSRQAGLRLCLFYKSIDIIGLIVIYERSIAVKNLLKFAKWLIALPFAIIEFAFTIIWAFAPIIQKLTIIFVIYLIWDGQVKLWIDKKDYISLADFILFALTLIFSQQIFALLMKLCQKIQRKIRYGVPFSENPQSQIISYQDVSGSQRVTLTMDQFKELMNRVR